MWERKREVKDYKRFKKKERSKDRRGKQTRDLGID